MLHFTFQNQGTGTAYVQALTQDKDGRLTTAYVIPVDGGVSKTFSTAIAGMTFAVHETPIMPGVLLPRGVAPANVEKPTDVPVDPAGSAGVARVSTQALAAEHEAAPHE